MRGDGNGWFLGATGRRYWGRFGAAGLLVRAPWVGGAGSSAVLLQHRAAWSHQGGTWSLPGGARDSHETAVQAALREADEEAGIDPARLHIRSERVTSVVAGGWTYTTVVADAPIVLVTTGNVESEELRWVPEDEVATLPLHPAFLRSWPLLHAVRVRDGGCGDVTGLPCTVDRGRAGYVWLY